MEITTKRLVSAVGLMSIGFGLFDSVRAQSLASKVGMRTGTAFRLAGAREIVTGIGALVPSVAKASIVARLVGDAIDVATLGVTSARPRNQRKAAAAVGLAIVAVVTTVDVLALRRLRRDQ